MRVWRWFSLHRCYIKYEQMKKIFLLGSSSYLIQQIANHLSKKKKYKLILISRKQSKKLINTNFYESDYSTSSIHEILLKELVKKTEKPIFIFGNTILQSDLYININEKFINDIININIILPSKIINLILKNYLRLSPSFFYLSSFAVNPLIGTSLYGSSKLFMENLMSNLAMEYGSMNCLFKSIRIGISDGGLANNLSEKELKSLSKRFSIKDVLKPKDIVKTLEFEFEKKSSNGKVIYCDNGFF